MLPVTYESIYSHDNLFAVKTESVLKLTGFDICKNRQRKVFFHLLTFPDRVMFANLMNYYHKFLGKEFGTNKYMKCKEKVVPNIVSVVYDLVALRKCQQNNLAKLVPGRKIKQEKINHFFFQCIYKVIRLSKPTDIGPLQIKLWKIFLEDFHNYF